MADKTNNYDGGENYQTETVDMYIRKVQQSQSYWNNRAAYYCIEKRDPAAKGALAIELRDYFCEINPLSSDCSMYADLLNHALGAVDWLEIAERLIDDLVESAAQEGVTI